MGQVIRQDLTFPKGRDGFWAPKVGCFWFFRALEELVALGSPLQGPGICIERVLTLRAAGIRCQDPKERPSKQKNKWEVATQNVGLRSPVFFWVV